MSQNNHQQTQAGRVRQSQLFIPGLSGCKPQISTSFRKLEEQARATLPPENFSYLAGGAGDESTMQANREAFERWRIVPRMLRDVSVRNTAVDLFGLTLPSPFLLAPIGVLELAHKEADLAVAKAAAGQQIPMIFSSQASVPMEECAQAMGDAPRWFQLYWSKSDELVASLVRRAENCGCSGIVLNVDTTMLGWRPRDLDLAYLPFLRGYGIAQYTSDPVFLASLDEPLDDSTQGKSGPVNLALLKSAAEVIRQFPGSFPKKLLSGDPMAAVQKFIATYSRPSLTWGDLGFLRERTRLPIIIKGLLHPEDAALALEYGADGILVSNHGGRQVDGALAALDALPAIVNEVDGRAPVLFDSGVRGGADIFKALALGASAVCLGRPYAYGLAVAGEAGVREVIENLKADFDLTMALSGMSAADQISQDCLVKKEL